MYTSSLASRSGVGPQIPTDGLIGLFDFGNPKSYPGTGTTVYNLAPSGGFNATLYNSPPFISRGAKSYVECTTTNQAYMYCVIPQFGPTGTIVSIHSAYAWNNGNANLLFSTPPFLITYDNDFYSLHVKTNDYQNNPDPAIAIYRAIDPTDLSPYFNYSKTLADVSFDLVRSVDMYVVSNNNATSTIGGYNNDFFSLTDISPGNVFTAQANYECLLGSYYVDPINQWLMDTNIYYNLIYNRALTIDELQNIYKSLKTRFGIR